MCIMRMRMGLTGRDEYTMDGEDEIGEMPYVSDAIVAYWPWLCVSSDKPHTSDKTYTITRHICIYLYVYVLVYIYNACKKYRKGDQEPTELESGQRWY